MDSKQRIVTNQTGKFNENKGCAKVIDINLNIKFQSLTRLNYKSPFSFSALFHFLVNRKHSNTS